MSDSLYNEFDPVSAKQWKQKIQVDLKGADYNNTLLTPTPEGINIKPFYHQDAYKTLGEIPGSPATWQVVQRVEYKDTNQAREEIQHAVAKGANAIWLAANAVFNPVDLFANLTLNGITIYADFCFLDPDFIFAFEHAAIKAQAKVMLRVDIVGNFASTGNWFSNNKEDHQALRTLWDYAGTQSTLGVSMELYANAGANAVQQLAYSLSHLNEYFNFLKSKDGALEVEQPSICITVATGSNYFMEIAKIRALRTLVSTLGEMYNSQPDLTVLATPTLRNKTIYDPNVNLLRTTTECMSAILGGANAICNQPYDVIYHQSNDFGERISRNQLLILKHESYFDSVSNPADGSYFIEELTQELAQNALDLFKEIEAKGGFMAGLRAGTIQRKIKENAARELEAFNSGESPLLGSNLFPNAQEQIKQTINVHPFVEKQVRKTQIEPIVRMRLAQDHEKNRLENE